MIVNVNSIAQYVIQVKNGIIKHVNVNVKIIVSARKIIIGILAHVFVRMVISNTSVIECNEIIIGMDNLSTKKTNTVATNVMSTASINCHSKKVRDYYILHTVSLAIILLLINIIIFYHNELKKVRIKNHIFR